MSFSSIYIVPHKIEREKANNYIMQYITEFKQYLPIISGEKRKL